MTPVHIATLAAVMHSHGIEGCTPAANPFIGWFLIISIVISIVICFVVVPFLNLRNKK